MHESAMGVKSRARQSFNSNKQLTLLINPNDLIDPIGDRLWQDEGWYMGLSVQRGQTLTECCLKT
ncbi:MAG: hypothetical protein GX811_07285 [Lentisphaerae bacterium]|nr:hypothetical protein [Lentisphaerota bacterium]